MFYHLIANLTNPGFLEKDQNEIGSKPPTRKNKKGAWEQIQHGDKATSTKSIIQSPADTNTSNYTVAPTSVKADRKYPIGDSEHVPNRNENLKVRDRRRQTVSHIIQFPSAVCMESLTVSTKSVHDQNVPRIEQLTYSSGLQDVPDGNFPSPINANPLEHHVSIEPTIRLNVTVKVHFFSEE